MQLSEFQSFYDYKEEDRGENSIKGPEFLSLVKNMLKQHKVDRVRDYLDVDGTFAVLFPASKKYTLKEAISLYEDIKDIIEYTTYTKVTKYGFIDDLLGYSGFWIHVQ